MILGFFVLPIAFCLSALAWGPHGEITQAALDTLGPDAALIRHLGTDAPTALLNGVAITPEK